MHYQTSHIRFLMTWGLQRFCVVHFSKQGENWSTLVYHVGVKNPSAWQWASQNKRKHSLAVLVMLHRDEIWRGKLTNGNKVCIRVCSGVCFSDFLRQTERVTDVPFSLTWVRYLRVGSAKNILTRWNIIQYFMDVE